MEHDDVALCGIDGKDSDPITHRAFNLWARRAMIHHVTPLTKQLNHINNMLNEHLIDERVQMAKLTTTIRIVGIGLAALISLVNSESVVRLLKIIL